MILNQRRRKQMKKRVCTLLLALVMVLGLIPTTAFAGTEVSSQWKNFRNSDVNMAITGAYTPKSAESTELKWAQKLGTGWTAAPSVQISKIRKNTTPTAAARSRR